MSNTETGSPESRLKGARKQLRLALEDVDDPAAAARIQESRRSARAAHDALTSVPITADPIPEDTTGERLVECVACGRTGLAERIHSTACPHDGAGGEEESFPSDEPGRTSKGIATSDEDDNEALGETVRGPSGGER